MALMLVVPSRAAGPEMLLPDLRQQLPADLTLTVVDGRTQFGFRSATENVGRGPLHIRGHRPTRWAKAMTATQLIHMSDGSTRRRRRAGRLRFVRGDDHQHWHLDDFMRYELRRERDLRLVRPGLKTGFCLGDRENVDSFSITPREPERPVFESRCGLNRPRLSSIHEGISVGYADSYAANFEGQFMDITALRAGRYWLVHRADPGRLLLEADETNNAASLLLDIRRDALPDGRRPLTVDVIRACPGVTHCDSSAR